MRMYKVLIFNNTNNILFFHKTFWVLKKPVRKSHLGRIYVKLFKILSIHIPNELTVLFNLLTVKPRVLKWLKINYMY